MKTTIIYNNNPFSFFNPWFESYVFDPIEPMLTSTINTSNHTPFAYNWEYRLPNFAKKDLKIEVHNGSLTIKAYKKNASFFKKKNLGEYLFNTQIQLSNDMDVEKINAKFKKGTLKIEIPRKTESVSYREIPVSGADTDKFIYDSSDNKKRWYDVLKEKMLKPFTSAA